jgi:hypothetical protein
MDGRTLNACDSVRFVNTTDTDDPVTAVVCAHSWC